MRISHIANCLIQLLLLASCTNHRLTAHRQRQSYYSATPEKKEIINGGHCPSMSLPDTLNARFTDTNSSTATISDTTRDAKPSSMIFKISKDKPLIHLDSMLRDIKLKLLFKSRYSKTNKFWYRTTHYHRNLPSLPYAMRLAKSRNQERIQLDYVTSRKSDWFFPVFRTFSSYAGFGGHYN